MRSRGPSGTPPKAARAGNEGEADETRAACWGKSESAEPGPERPATQWQERKTKTNLLSRRPITYRCALSKDGRAFIVLARLYLGEGVGKSRSGADQPGENPEVVAAHGQHTAVEILTFDLDRGEEALEDLTLGATDIVQAGEIDGDVLR